ncbi:MAG: terminase small subunit, partial [Nitrospiraceae bacterium]
MTPACLTPKQHRFIEEFLVDGNKTEALIRAGFSRRGARQYASKLYDKLRQIIEPRLAAQRRALAASSLKTKEKRMKELKYAAFLDPAECFDEHGRPLSIREIPEHIR